VQTCALPICEDIQIKSYKHDGSLHRVWDSSIVLKGTEKVVIGANDKTVVTEGDGRSWITREPAICYFHVERWFNIIGMLKTDGIHYYRSEERRVGKEGEMRME